MADPWDILRWGAGAVMLLMGAVLDVRERRVANKTWFPFVALAVFFALHDILQATDWIALAWSYGGAAVLCGVFYALWWLGLFGGADAKALMVAAFLSPNAIAPARPLLPMLPPALDALVNGTVVLLALPILLLAWNLAQGQLRLPAAFLGYRTTLAKARAAHVWPMQRVAEDGSLKWRYWQRPAASMDETYAALETSRVTDVWVTPKLPFLVPVAVGWLLAGLLGNLALDVVVRFV